MREKKVVPSRYNIRVDWRRRGNGESTPVCWEEKVLAEFCWFSKRFVCWYIVQAVSTPTYIWFEKGRESMRKVCVWRSQKRNTESHRKLSSPGSPNIYVLACDVGFLLFTRPKLLQKWRKLALVDTGEKIEDCAKFDSNLTFVLKKCLLEMYSGCLQSYFLF